MWVTTIILSLILPIGLLKRQLSLKKTIALSSVRNNRWFIVLTLSIPLFILFLIIYAASLYCLFYVIRKREKIKETKDKLGLTPLIVIINIGGMPPSPIFWTKLLSLSIILRYNTTEYIILVLLLSSCVFMYFYIKSTILTTLRRKNIRQINGWLIIRHSFITIEIISTVVIILIATLFFIFI